MTAPAHTPGADTGAGTGIGGPLITARQVAAAATSLGTVAALYLRRANGAAPEQVSQVQAWAASGLDGDIGRDALSPRQVLLAGTPAYARLGLAPNALRENILLDIDTAGLASGQLLAIGPDAVFWLSFPCEPCGRLNLRQAQLSRHIGVQRGMLARVLRSGTVTSGDPVCLLPSTLLPWPTEWRPRVEAVLAQVPPGMVIEYRQLARLAGVALSYCRVFPRLARELGLADKAVPTSRSRPGKAGGAGRQASDLSQASDLRHASHESKASLHSDAIQNGNANGPGTSSQLDAALPRWDGSGLFDSLST